MFYLNQKNELIHYKVFTGVSGSDVPVFYSLLEERLLKRNKNDTQYPIKYGPLNLERMILNWYFFSFVTKQFRTKESLFCYQLNQLFVFQIKLLSL